MTTIAYKHADREVSIDSRITQGHLITCDDYDKTRERDGHLFLFTGKVCDYDLLMAYFFNDADRPETVPDCQAMVISPDKVMLFATVTKEGILEQSVVNYDYTLGSGGDFALAAMDHGSNSADAVRYAANRDVYTGGDIRTISLT